MKRFEADALKNLMHAQMLENDVCPEAAFHISEALAQTSLRGVDSHGINLFPHYSRVSSTGRICPHPTFAIERQSASTAVFDAGHGYGHHAGAEAMQLAISLAKDTGIGAVVVKNSSHFAAAAYYGFMAAEQDFIGVSFTNANDTVMAFNATRPFFGTNPICVTAPMLSEGPFCLDMATAALAVNRLGNYKRTNTPLQPGLAFDQDGQPTIDPQLARFVAPCGGYKGFGLGMMVELFCGLLAGGPVATELIPIYQRLTDKRSISHFFMAIDISRFIDTLSFKTRLQKMADDIRALPRSSADTPVMIPGDPEKAYFIERSASGIPVDEPKYEEFLAVNPAFAKALM